MTNLNKTAELPGVGLNDLLYSGNCPVPNDIMLAQGPVDVTVSRCSVDGTIVFPRYAYTSDEYWLSHFETIFSDKAKRMRAYSDGTDGEIVITFDIGHKRRCRG